MQDYNGPGTFLCVWDEYEERCLAIGVNVNPVNDAPFLLEMHAPVDIRVSFTSELMDVDSLVATKSE